MPRRGASFMKSVRCVFLLLTILPGLAPAQYVPSKERSKFDERRKTYTNANQVGTTIFNFGITGRTTSRPDEIPYEWPRNTRRLYMALTSPMYGADVVDDLGVRRRIATAALGKPDRDNGSSWELQPITGYINYAHPRGAVANLLDKDSWAPTWPDKLEDVNDPGWPGSWNGLFGKVPPDLSVKTADQEFVF